MARLSIMDRIGLILAGSALVTVGWVTREGVADIAARMPWHHEIGTTFLAIGVLTLLANVSVRAKSLVIIIITGGWAAAAIWAAITMDDLAILQRGLIGLTGALAAIFALTSIPKLVTGADAAD